MKGACYYCMNENQNDICSNCGKNNNDYSPAPHHLVPGTILNGKYLIGAVLGEGGFGITYIGRDTVLDVVVAIKEYFPSGIVNRSNTVSMEITSRAEESFEKGKKRFLDEARTLAKFSNNPNVVSVRDFFTENNTAYIVMEYLEGVDLKEYIEKNGTLSFNNAFSMLSPVMSALSKIHACDLIHRDISPANIMVLNDGTVKLLDFGAARNVGGLDEKSLSIMLKPGFAPEEQYRTKGNQGPWTDVYALSATMYKIITGTTPDDAMNRLFSDELASPDKLNASLTERQSAVLLKGMAIHQADRYQSIDELQNACKNAIANDAQQTAVPSVPYGDEEKTVMDYQAGSVASNMVADEKTIFETEKPYATDEKTVFQAQKTEENESSISLQAEHSVKENYAIKTDKTSKKPNKIGLVFSTVLGAATLLFLSLFLGDISATSSQYESSPLTWVILAVIFAVPTFFLARTYFCRIDNKSMKPSKCGLIFHIVSFILTIVAAIDAYLVQINPSSDDGSGSRVSLWCLVVSCVLLTGFFGYFFYPRLEKKKRQLSYKILGGLSSIAVIALIVGIAVTAFSTVTIGDQKVKKSETELIITADLITSNDMQELKKLRKLESLEIKVASLDNEDVQVLGELIWLKELSVQANEDITDVSPLNNLTDLTFLNLNNTGVADISCLNNLTQLEILGINGTQVPDVSIIKKYDKLKELHMSGLEQLDVSTIALPSTVEMLDVSDNKLTNFAFINGHTALRTLTANNVGVADLSPLATCSDLYHLEIKNNGIFDLSPLSNCKNLEDLYADDNEIADITPLKGIAIRSLKCNNNKVADLSPLSDNTRIYFLELNNNNISDISPLANCVRITILSLNNNHIQGISAIKNFSSLSTLEVEHNEIHDISVLSSPELIKLERFSLAYNEIEDISSLASLETAKNSDTHGLNLQHNRIKNIDALKGYKNILSIDLNDNEITDISALSTCTSLNTVNLANNKISDLSPLNGLPSLRCINAEYNPIKNYGAIKLANKKDPGVEAVGAIGSTFSISYDENVNYQSVKQQVLASDTFLVIYDVPEHKKDPLSQNLNMSFRLRFKSKGETLDDISLDNPVESEE